MIYATRQANGGQIAEHASIRQFETREQAEAWLLAGGDGGLRPRIVVGRFASPWKQTPVDEPPALVLENLAQPFAPDEIEILEPGEHPGGPAYAYTPTAEVLVVVESA